MTGRELLEALGPILGPARQIRYEPDEIFDDVDVDDLERAARSLKAIAYSCTTGARKLESIAARRRGNPVPSAAGTGNPVPEAFELLRQGVDGIVCTHPVDDFKPCTVPGCPGGIIAADGLPNDPEFDVDPGDDSR